MQYAIYLTYVIAIPLMKPYRSASSKIIQRRFECTNDVVFFKWSKRRPGVAI